MKVHLVEPCLSETIALKDCTCELRSAYFLNVFASLSTLKKVYSLQTFTLEAPQTGAEPTRKTIPDYFDCTYSYQPRHNNTNILRITNKLTHFTAFRGFCSIHCL
jgi:hypothetical protein